MIINQVKTVLLLGALTGLLLVAGQVLGGRQGLFIGLTLAILMNFGSYFFSDKIVLKMYKAKEASKQEYPGLYGMVKEISQNAGIPMPKVYIIPTQNSNAFATGRDPKHAVIACTEGIMKVLSKEELKGVIAHEISHVKNRDILIQTVAATIAGVISYLALFARFGAMFGGYGRGRDGGGMFELLALAILTPLIAMIIQLAISRSREYLADESGAKLVKDGKPLATALEKLEINAKQNPMRFGNKVTSSLFIVNPFRVGTMVKLFSTHPSTKERVKRLNEFKF